MEGGNFIGLAGRPRSTGVAIESLTHSFFSAVRIIISTFPAPMSSRPGIHGWLGSFVNSALHRSNSFCQNPPNLTSR